MKIVFILLITLNLFAGWEDYNSIDDLKSETKDIKSDIEVKLEQIEANFKSANSFDDLKDKALKELNFSEEEFNALKSDIEELLNIINSFKSEGENFHSIQNQIKTLFEEGNVNTKCNSLFSTDLLIKSCEKFTFESEKYIQKELYELIKSDNIILNFIDDYEPTREEAYKDLSGKSFEIGWYFWMSESDKAYLARRKNDDSLSIWHFTNSRLWLPIHNASAYDSYPLADNLFESVEIKDNNITIK